MKLIVFVFILTFTHSSFAQNAKIELVPNQPYTKYELKTKRDTITFYLSVSSNKEKLPLVVFVQGSGMNSLFSKNQHGRIRTDYGHISWYDMSQEKYRILIVEKPGVKFLQTGESFAFDKKFSLETWSNTIIDAINYILQYENVEPGKILIAGHSEGGVVASRVANLMKDKISNVAIMAGEGPSQLYSLYQFAHDGTFFNTPEHNMPNSEQRLKYLTEVWSDILIDPANTDKKFWGFTYLRWSSMLRTSVIDELTDYPGKVLIIQGTADKAVFPESAIVSYTSLLSKGRKVELELIENADHSFYISDKPKVDGWKMTIEKITQWFKG